MSNFHIFSMCFMCSLFDHSVQEIISGSPSGSKIPCTFHKIPFKTSRKTTAECWSPWTFIFFSHRWFSSSLIFRWIVFVEMLENTRRKWIPQRNQRVGIKEVYKLTCFLRSEEKNKGKQSEIIGYRENEWFINRKGLKN